MPKKPPPQTKRQKLSNWIILGAIALMGGATYWIVKSNYQSPSQEYLAPKFSKHLIELSIYDNDTGKVYQAGKTENTKALFFKVSTTFPAYIALMERSNQQSAKIIYSGTRLPPGKDRLVERLGEKFVYTLKPTHGAEVCVVYADSEDGINHQLEQIAEGNFKDLTLQCVSMN